jgi:hypothetical protein
MLLELPKDVIWLILKQCLIGMYNDMRGNHLNIHEKNFLASRIGSVGRCHKWFLKTFDKNTSEDDSMHVAFFVDFLYPLRLVCQQFNSIMIKKIRKRIEDETSFINVLF